MKAVMMAVQNLTVAFGDVIVIILIPILAKLFDKQVRLAFKHCLNVCQGWKENPLASLTLLSFIFSHFATKLQQSP